MIAYVLLLLAVVVTLGAVVVVVPRQLERAHGRVLAARAVRVAALERELGINQPLPLPLTAESWPEDDLDVALRDDRGRKQPFALAEWTNFWSGAGVVGVAGNWPGGDGEEGEGG